MKKIISLTALILCVAMVLASCSFSDMSFKKFYKDLEYKAPNQLTKSNQITAIDGLEFERAYEHLLLFTTKDGETYKIYNAKTDAIVLTMDTENMRTDFFTAFETPFIKVTETKTTDDTTTTYVRLYTAKGALITEAKNPTDTSINTNLDFFKFNGVFYRVNKDGSATACSYYLENLPGITQKTENYYYAVASNQVSVYDNDLNCVFYWEFPSANITNQGIYLLEEGILLAQGVERLPDDASKYDYASSGTKYNVVSFILNVEKDKATEEDLDYRVSYVLSMDRIYNYQETETNSLPKSVINYATVKFINEHRLDSRETEVVIKKNGETIKLAPEFESLPDIAVKDRWIYTRYNGEQYLINEKGDIIGNITGVGYSDRNENFICMGEKILDYDLNVVYDAKTNGKRIINVLQTSIILADESPDSEGKTNYYLYKADKTLSKIDNYEDSEYLYYVTFDSENETGSIYAENGKLLLTLDIGNSGLIYEDDTPGSEMMIVGIEDDEGNIHYHKIS